MDMFGEVALELTGVLDQGVICPVLPLQSRGTEENSGAEEAFDAIAADQTSCVVIVSSSLSWDYRLWLQD